MLYLYFYRGELITESSGGRVENTGSEKNNGKGRFKGQIKVDRVLTLGFHSLLTRTKHMFSKSGQ